MDDPRARALAAYDRAVWIITAGDAAERAGLVATFVNSASLVPALPRLTVGIARHHHTWTAIRRCRAFASHLVDEDQIALVWRFGLASGRDGDKFDGIAWRHGRTGSPLIDGTLAWVECTVEAEFDIGDRTIFLGEVVDGGVEREADALTARQVFVRATPAQRLTMDQDRARDEALDETAILAWRAAQSGRRR